MILTANLDTGAGEVKFGGIREDTSFRVEGLDRRWNWCLASDGTYDCAFVVSVSGSGAYYNFRASADGTAKPSDLFTCERLDPARAGTAPLTGNERRRIQTALAAEGFSPGPADGKFGPRTRQAVTAWQRARGYPATGYLTDAQAAELLD